MADIGHGYGSEWHLLRYLGRHRTALDRAVADAIGGERVTWVDAPFDRSSMWHDGELKALDFLPPGHAAASAWPGVWPPAKATISWDAIGRIHVGGQEHWLLVEAKAHTGELSSSCKASEGGGLPLIRSTMERTKAALNVGPERDWLNGYYQFCNRVAALHHLIENGAPAKLLFIYFTGDTFKKGRANCPGDAEAWQTALEVMDAHVGLPRSSPIRQHISKVFLPVAG